MISPDSYNTLPSGIVTFSRYGKKRSCTSRGKASSKWFCCGVTFSGISTLVCAYKHYDEFPYHSVYANRFIICGAGAGAVAGAVVTGGSPVGTAAGAAVGGLIGHVIGDEMDDEKD
tara:strand:- start:98 stop:445 length:348 start_codon:yes stop_codon:yes gene_type:complete